MIELLHTRSTTTRSLSGNTNKNNTKQGNDDVDAIHRISEQADNYSVSLFAQQVYISHSLKKGNNDEQTGEWFPHANSEKQQFSNVMHHSNLLYLASKALHFFHHVKKEKQETISADAY